MHRRTERFRSERASTWRATLGFLCALLAVAAVALEHGFYREILPVPLLIGAQVAASWAALYVSGEVRPSLSRKTHWPSAFSFLSELAVVLSLGLEVADVQPSSEIASALVFTVLACRFNSFLARRLPEPSLLLPASFIVLIAMSTALLMLPVSTPPDRPIGAVDALFTATSSVCVTGLIVRDTASGFTPFGQTVIAASIQLGALGVMIFGSTLAMLLGGRLSLRENITLSTALNEYPSKRLVNFAWFIVITTVTLELVGAGLLYFTWPDSEVPPGASRLGLALFHSVSAFANAGFDITGESLVGLRWNPSVFTVFVPLIVLGGLGFIVLDDVWRWGIDRARKRRNPRRLTLHSRIVLVTTLALIASGWAVIFVAQSQLPGLSMTERSLDAMFMSVTARTAGFNTVPMDELAAGSRFMLMSLMIVGGSPGGTAGGLKTIVFALLVLAVISTLRGRSEVEVFKRAIPDELIKRAATIAFAIATLISLNIILLDLTETIPFEELLFEVISAATTTGLSLGATETLSPFGRVIISVTMLLGRVGPLVFAASFVSLHEGKGQYTYPHDSVTMG